MEAGAAAGGQVVTRLPAALRRMGLACAWVHVEL